MVTSCVFEPEQRLTVGLYGLAAILLPIWERVGVSAAEGDGIPLKRRIPRSALGMQIWADSEEAVRKHVSTMFVLAHSMATASDYLRSSAFGTMGLERCSALCDDWRASTNARMCWQKELRCLCPSCSFAPRSVASIG
jgi:hypothetical protein